MDRDAALRMASELGMTPARLQHLRQAPFRQAVQDLERFKAEAKRNFRRLALKYHPDQNQERQEEAAQDFILLGQVLKEIQALQVTPPAPAQPAPMVEEDLSPPAAPPATTYFRWQSAGIDRPYNARRVAFIRG